MSQDAVDALVKLLDLEPIEVNIFRGVSPDEKRQRVFGGQVAGQALVAAARTVDARHVRPLAARLLPAARRPDRPDPLRGRPHPRRPLVHHPPRRRHPARQGDLQPVGVVPHAPSPGSSTSCRCRDVPDPDEVPDFRTRWAPWKREARRLVRPAPPDRHPPRRLGAARPQGAAAAVPARVAPGRRPAARRPARAHVRAHVRVGHDPARHRPAAGRRRASRRGPADDGEPRPRHVVPPPVPRRRVAALRAGHAVGVRRPGPGPRASSTRRTATSWCRWCKRGSSG